MSWNYDTSLVRAQRKLEEVADVEVSKLNREMDFENISLKHAKKIHGAHIYIDVANFDAVVDEAFGSDGDEEELLRRQHIYARELTRVVEKDFPAAKVHFQGPRLHVVVYRPIDDDAAISIVAAATAAAVAVSVTELFNPLFDGIPFDVATGIALGDTIATKNNVRGDRELLFLGKPANRAAKILSSGIAITEELADALPTEWAGYLRERGEGVLELELPSDLLEKLVEDKDWGWSREQCKQRLDEALEKFPAGCTGISGAAGNIDKSRLSLSNSKRVTGISIFADVDGFTDYVDQASSIDEDLVTAVRAYHVFRSEMRYVAVDDYGALRIQYQGDRMQALAFLPVDDDAAIALRAVEIGGGLNASVAYTLPLVIPDAVRPLAIGQSLGTTLLSRLGEHGQPDVVCLGPAVKESERFQLRLDGNEHGISKGIRDLLPEDLAQEFKWVASKGCYITRDLRADKIDRLLEARALDAGKVASVSVTRDRGDTSGRPWQA